MTRQMAVLALCVAIGGPLAGAEPSEHIYLITTEHKLASSGFLLRGAGGIITCLHGVAGAKEIRAKRSTGEPFKESLKLTKVDIAHDLALLSSSEVAQLKGGLDYAVGTDLSSLKQVTVQVIGYPVGVNWKEVSNTLQVQKPPTRKLDYFLNPDLRTKFDARRSPATDITILCLQGPLYPGHSGAPILDPEGNVLAVANGGLGYFDQNNQLRVRVWKDTELVWAIPLKDITWTDAKDAKNLREIDRLTTLPLLGCFAIGDSKKMRLVLTEYVVLEAPTDRYTLVVLKKTPEDTVKMLKEYEQTGIQEAFRFLSRGGGGQNGLDVQKQALEAEEKQRKLYDGLFYYVEPGTQVEILPDEGRKANRLAFRNLLPADSHYRVRILTGKYEGKEGWAPGHFVRRKQVGAINQ